MISALGDWLTGLTADTTLFLLVAVLSILTLLIISVTAMLILDEPERRRRAPRR